MPIIASFDGIKITMYFLSDHNPPHIHAYYAEYSAKYSIQNAQLIDGYLPPKQHNKVIAYINNNRTNLLLLWNQHNAKELS